MELHLAHYGNRIWNEISNAIQTLWIWVVAVAQDHPSYVTAKGRHIIQQREVGCIYITVVPPSNTLRINNPPVRKERSWLADRALASYFRNEEITRQQDHEDWRIIGERATRGCYIEGETFSYYIVEEIGLYVDSEAPITPGLDSKYLQN